MPSGFGFLIPRNEGCVCSVLWPEIFPPRPAGKALYTYMLGGARTPGID